MTRTKTVFVGQGPNQTAWKHGLASGVHAIERGSKLSAEMYAEYYCRRVAITGRIGEKIAGLVGLHRLNFYRRYRRENLNKRWNGKKGKGDTFNREEARLMATVLAMSDDLEKYILLGAEVSLAFGFPFEPLKVHDLGPGANKFFLLPHPSGIVQWWNDPENAARASKALKQFLAPEPPNP